MWLIIILKRSWRGQSYVNEVCEEIENDIFFLPENIERIKYTHHISNSTLNKPTLGVYESGCVPLSLSSIDMRKFNGACLQ